MKAQINICKIAKEARVSVATVSRVLNNFPYVEDTTRKNVLKIIKKYNYAPNFFARGLSSKKSEIIALFTPINFSTNSFYFTEILKGINEETAASGYNLLLPSPIFEDYLKLFTEKKIDGAILLAPSKKDPKIKILFEKKFPAVLVNSKIRNIPRVDIDNHLATETLLSHLLKLGHKKIAFIAGPSSSANAQERLRAYKVFLKKHKLPSKNKWILKGNFELEKAYLSVRKLFLSNSDLPTAVFASNDLMAIGALKALKELNYPVPQKVSVTGFDDIDMAAHINPTLTTIRQPLRQLGREAVSLLIKIIKNQPTQREIILESEMVLRESTGKIK